MNTRNRAAAGMAIFAAPLIVVLAGLLVTGPAGRALAKSPLPKTEQVDQIFATWDTAYSPGCAVAVIQNGSIVYSRGYGMADLDHNLKIAPSTVFHAASLSKQFTAMSVMLLVGQGRLSLDDDVRTYVPELPENLGARITVGDLLRHISGIRDQWIFVTMAGWRVSDDVIRLEDVIHFVKRMKALNFTPRDRYLYSNTGYTLAGLIVEKVSGRPLADFARDNIFSPLGMANTRFAKTHSVIVQNRAYGYTDQPYQMRMPNYDLTGPTNLLTTVEDLARWDRNFDDKTVGGAAALSQMQTPAQLANGSTAPYGLGLMIAKYRGLNVIEHDGRDPGYRAHLIRFPDQHLAVACLCNLVLPNEKLPGALVRQVADVYLEGQFPVATQDPEVAPPQRAIAPAALPPAEWAEYEGQYYSDEIDTVYNVERHGSSISITRPKYPATLLTPDSRDKFTMLGFSVVLSPATVRFTRDAQQHVTGLLIDGDHLFNFKFNKR